MADTLANAHAFFSACCSIASSAPLATVSSEDVTDEFGVKFENGSFSADVSQAASSSEFSSGHCDRKGGSSSLSSPSLAGTESAYDSDYTGPIQVLLPVVGDRHVVIPAAKTEKPESKLSEVEVMKERFARLLLGEDMSGGGKGVSTALAISNAITNLSVTVFGELRKLEPLAPDRKSLWRREMDWLLCASESIVELTPAVQEFPRGGTLEVMVSRRRSDLNINLPALDKLDSILLSILDGFADSDFYYVHRGIIDAGIDDSAPFPGFSPSRSPSFTLEEKWWLPFPKVPSNGLSDQTRKRLRNLRDCAAQIHKAALAINSSVLAEMEIPNDYFDSLPKSGKACVGETLYRHIKADQFFPECLLDYLDLSSENTILDEVDRLEAALHFWQQKMRRRQCHPKSGNIFWGGEVKSLIADIEKSKLLAQRAEILLQSIRLRFPGLPQTSLDRSKIQHNKDIGHAIIESYSRAIKTVSINIMRRIDDLLFVDDATRQLAAAECASNNKSGFKTASSFTLSQKIGTPDRRQISR